MYEQQHNKEMSVKAAAQMLSNTLYYRRFFPFYVNCILAGLDDEGAGSKLVAVSALTDPCHAIVAARRKRRSLQLRSGGQLRARGVPCRRLCIGSPAAAAGQPGSSKLGGESLCE
jgi:hypothetical protein